MVKQRMTSLDVRASVEEMRNCLLGLRLLNLYDLSPTMYLFKFGHGEKKHSVLLESGIRLHLTRLVRETPRLPSQFTLKLRKHVRAWRLNSITQMQHDRTIDMCFGVAASTNCFHIIIELFSRGNVVLTDHSYTIMMLLRTHKDNDVKLMVHSVYPVTADEETINTVESNNNNNNNNEANLRVSDAGGGGCDAVVDCAAHEEETDRRVAMLAAEWRASFDKQSDYESIKAMISDVRHFGNSLAEYVLAATDTVNVKKKNLKQSADELFAQLLPGMLSAWDLQYSTLPPGGYLIAMANRTRPSQLHDAVHKNDENGSVGKGTPASSSEAAAAAVTLAELSGEVVHYEDFTPLLLTQHQKPGYIATHRASFGVVCDTFFLPTERDKIDHHNAQQQKTVLSKREKFERDHARRISALEREQEMNYRRGELILTHAERVDAALGLINGALAAGIQWEALHSLLKRRHEEGHPVAYMIHELGLERNTMTVLLEQTELYDDEDDKDVCPVAVELDLAKSSYANADSYFNKRKANQVKLQKTLAATAKAAAGALHKGTREAAKTKTRKRIVVERMRNWWERFRWFRTSAGDVVLQGRDIPSTDILMRQRAQLGDVFIYCDMDGALPCLLRPLTYLWRGSSDGTPHTAQGSTNINTEENNTDSNNTPSSAVCPAIARISIEEAGTWCVSNSRAWETKQSVGAWWVYASQLTGGSAATRYTFHGDAHHILPQPLALGCALLFRVSRDMRESKGSALCGDATMREMSRESDLHVHAWEQQIHTDTGSGNYAHKDERRRTDYVMGDGATDMPVLPPPPKSANANASSYARTAAQNQCSHKGATQTQTQTHAAVANAAAVTPMQNHSNTEADNEGVTPSTRPAQLTSRQRRKLKKIQDRYGDQDEEDRLFGAQLNGNHLSKVHRIKPSGEEKTTTTTPNTRRKKKDDDDDDKHHNSEEADTEKIADQEREGDAETVTAALHINDAEAEGEAEEDDVNANGEESQQREEQQPHDSSSSSSRASTANVNDTTNHAPHTSKDTVSNNNNYNNSSSTGAAELASAFVHWTASPLPSDTIQHVEMVCAPFSTVVSYPYRVELTMGNVKKGAVAHSIVASLAQRAARQPYAIGVSECSHESDTSRNKDHRMSGSKQRVGGDVAKAPTTAAAAAGVAGVGEENTQSNVIRDVILNIDMGYFVEQLRAHAKPLNIHATR